MDNQNEKCWSVETKPSGGYVSWRPGFGLPFRWTTRLDREDLPYEVELDFITNEGGPQCRAVRFLARAGGDPIGTLGIRKIPLAECIEVAITSAAAREEREPGVVSYAIPSPGFREDVSEPLRLARARGRHIDDHLRRVAEVYLSAGGKKPTQAVQEHWLPCSYSTAARWVGKARKRGYIPPVNRKKED